jgi:hypothetical protein
MVGREIQDEEVAVINRTGYAATAWMLAKRMLSPIVQLRARRLSLRLVILLALSLCGFLVMGYHTHYGIAGSTDSNGVSVGTNPKSKASASSEVNMFANPAAVYDTVRPPILGFDSRDGGSGPISGLPYLNLDLSVKKNVLVWEHGSLEFSGVFFNVMNHLDFSNPSLSLQSTANWGTTKTQGNTPRQIEMGLRASF